MATLSIAQLFWLLEETETFVEISSRALGRGPGMIHFQL